MEPPWPQFLLSRAQGCTEAVILEVRGLPEASLVRPRELLPVPREPSLAASREG